jgi:uncharacterized membrane protein
MTLQWIGPLMALLTVGTIAFGHVLVRWLHARFGTRPGGPLLGLGLLLLIASLFSRADWVSAVLGVLGITTFWDGVEVFHQEKRMRRDAALQEARGTSRGQEAER